MLHAVVAGEAFRDAAVWTVRICPSRHAEPVLQGMLIESTESELRLSAYDYNTSGSALVSAVVRTPGRLLVSGRLLAAISKTLDPSKDVSLIDDGNELRMTSGRNVWTLPRLTIEDYPILPVPGETVAKIDSATLRRAVHRVLPAADREPQGPLHGAINIVSAGQRLCLAATDRWRLAVAEIDWYATRGDSEIDLLVPTIFLDATFAALAPSSSTVEFGVSPRVISFATPSQSLTGRLGAGKTAPWRNALPPVDAPVSAIFVVDQLATALDRATVVTEDAEKAIRLSMGPAGFELEAVDGMGTATAEAPVSEYIGEGKALGIKPRYLRAVLDTMESDLALVRTTGRPGAPLDFVPLDDDGVPVTDYRHIIMPVMLSKVQGRNGRTA